MKGVVLILLLCEVSFNIENVESGMPGTLVWPATDNSDYDVYDDNENPLMGSEDVYPAPEETTNGVKILFVQKKILQDIGSMENLSQLEKELGIERKPVNTTEPQLQLRFSNNDLYIENPEQAHCEPMLQTVDLELKNSDSVTYYPTCVRVMRCGGCCRSPNVISCQPTSSSNVIINVLKLDQNEQNNKLTNSRRRARRGVKVAVSHINVTVEQHDKCECMCKTKESDCDLSVQIYDKLSCTCFCKNKDEQKKCHRKKTHYWNENTCECLCRKKISCSTSETFDHKTCSCITTRLEIDFYERYGVNSRSLRRSSIGRSVSFPITFENRRNP